MLFDTGKKFPDNDSIKRLSKYARGKAYFSGTSLELYERASEILKETPHAKYLKSLYIGCNIIDPLTTKPADLMFGEEPIYESGFPDDSQEQQALNRLVRRNNLNKQGYEMVLGAGVRGDGWLKVMFDYREDYSEYVSEFGEYPPEAKPEVIIETVPAQYVFPEVSETNVKKFKAVNIAFVTWEDKEEATFLDRLLREDDDEIPFLNVERHIPGRIYYYKFRLHPTGVNNDYNGQVQEYMIGERVPTGLDEDVVDTGLPFIPIIHCPYKSVDDQWEGISNIEKVESLLSAINDRLVQIDYILWKHADPVAYGPPTGVDQIKLAGRYIPVDKNETTPGYMEWNSQLTAAFEELDRLIGMVFAICETPQWIFGSAFTSLGSNQGGTGTSHTDGAAIRTRFMPILSKVNRIRMYADKALRDALWAAQLLEQHVRQRYNLKDIPAYEPTYPSIVWRDGLPDHELEQAEIMQLRLASGTIDRYSAIKRLEGMDDEKAALIYEAIQNDKQREIEQMNEAMSFELDWDRQRNIDEEVAGANGGTED